MKALTNIYIVLMSLISGHLNAQNKNIFFISLNDIKDAKLKEILDLDTKKISSDSCIGKCYTSWQFNSDGSCKRNIEYWNGVLSQTEYVYENIDGKIMLIKKIEFFSTIETKHTDYFLTNDSNKILTKNFEYDTIFEDSNSLKNIIEEDQLLEFYEFGKQKSITWIESGKKKYFYYNNSGIWLGYFELNSQEEFLFNKYKMNQIDSFIKKNRNIKVEYFSEDTFYSVSGSDLLFDGQQASQFLLNFQTNKFIKKQLKSLPVYLIIQISIDEYLFYKITN